MMESLVEFDGLGRLLIIDDDPGILKAFQRLFHKKYIVFAAGDLKETYDILHREFIEVVVCDQWLPDGPGNKLLHDLKDKFPNIVRLLITGCTNIELAIDAINEGTIYRYITKPWDSIEIHTIIEEAFQRYHFIEGRKRRIAQLKESEERFRDICEYNADGIMIVDVQGIVLYANLAAKKMFEVQTSRLVGDDFGFPIAAGETSEINILGGNLHQRTAEMRVAETRWEEEKAYVVTLRDITERIVAEQELKQHRNHLEMMVRMRTAELESEIERHKKTAEDLARQSVELNRTNEELLRIAKLKDEFLAGMSHELRTPLNSILSPCEVLLEKIFGPLTEKQEQYIQRINDSAQHLLSLINDILDVSKYEAGMMVLEYQDTTIQELCEAALQMTRHFAKKKNIEIVVKIHEPPDTIQADKRRVVQILVNLLSNAIKFTASGGRIGLEVDAEPNRGAVKFIVWDTGIGIEKEDMVRLFKPFVQLDSRLSRKYDGTGLGLALVSRLVKLHGGNISVESEPGSGSCFTVSIPQSHHPDSA